MDNRYLKYGALKAQIAVQRNVVIKGQRYWDISKTLVMVFMVFELLGLLWPIIPGLGAIKFIPRLCLSVNIILGLFVIYRAASAIVTLDWLQEFLPEKKKDEIESYLQTGRVAKVVGTFLALLLIPSIWDANENLEMYFLVLAMFAVGAYLTGFGAPEESGKKPSKAGKK